MYTLDRSLSILHIFHNVSSQQALLNNGHTLNMISHARTVGEKLLKNAAGLIYHMQGSLCICAQPMGDDVTLAGRIHKMITAYNRNTAWLRDTVRQTSRGKSAAAGRTAGPPRPLTSRGTSAWPYRVTTQYSFYPVQICSQQDNSEALKL